MSEQLDIDIKENYIQCLDEELLSILLKDRSSGKNIIWATDIYAEKGSSYDSQEPITVKLITGRLGKVIRPRTDKSKKEQQIRIKDKAEVFTPSWICNEMNNHINDEWFERKNVFNKASEKQWITNKRKIKFSNEKGKTWKDYVKLKVLEISCGEAPFLVSRYDTTTGQWINVGERIGALDRKLRVVNENTNSEQEWYEWALNAIKSTFGYEWQGDSLLIARENILFTFIDYYIDRFKNFPIKEYLIEIAKILSWNIWQMDGLKYVVPNSCKPKQERQISLFQDEECEPCVGCLKNDNGKHIGTYCKIMNWDTNRTIKFYKGEKIMKFDFVIGNPPYQGESKEKLYPWFYVSSKKIAKVVELIFPTGWQEPKTNRGLKIMNTKEVKEDSQIVFIDNKQNVFNGVTGAEWTNIILWKNGYDNGLDGKQKLLTEGQNPQVIKLPQSTEEINKPAELLKLYNCVKEHSNKFLSEITSKSKPYMLMSDAIKKPEFYKLEPFNDSKQADSDITVIHLDGIKYVPKDYKFPRITIAKDKYKVLIPFVWGNLSQNYIGGAYANIGIAKPNEVCTASYIESGAFESFEIAKKHAKYLMTRFLRALLFLDKFSPVCVSAFGKIPQQDYEESFWNKSIDEIDEALMNKYNVSQDIKDFIYNNIQRKTEKNIEIFTKD